MRELQLKSFCDVCRITGSPDLDEGEEIKEPAVTSFTVGIVAGESRPVPKVLDVCADHTGALEDLLALMGQIHQLPGDAPTVASKAKVKAKAAPVKVAAMRAPARDASRHAERQCPICHRWSTTASLTSHIWKLHRPDAKPAQPEFCPECGDAYVGSGMSSHRRLSHGFDAVADALSGVPGYGASKELPSGQMELTG